MKRILSFILILCLLGGLIGCGEEQKTPAPTTKPTTAPTVPTTKPMDPAVGQLCDGTDGQPAELGDANTTFGESLDSLNAYAGYFEEDMQEITVEYVSGTNGSYTLEGNVLTFTAVSEDSVYAVSGRFKGSIVIDVGDEHKFDLELKGLCLVSEETNPITVLSGDEVSITAKSEYQNFIYDTRPRVNSNDENVYSGAIHSEVDLEICGKGELTVVSQHNNGIHGKDDLQVKNLSLLVACMDNALKGNDSVEIKNANTLLIAAAGDGIKTSNSNVSSKGNQRGTITITGGKHGIYAACDGIDAAYDVEIDDENTKIWIFTDKYSNYSTEVTTVDENHYFIRFTSTSYRYSVKYYNSDEDYVWVNADYHSAVSSGRSTYHYYSYPRLSGYEKVQFFIYDLNTDWSQEETYLAKSDYLTPNPGYDTFALSAQNNSLSYQWTNYTKATNQNNGFGGGSMDGNTDKGDYSTKGIKASNEIRIMAGTVNIKAYDDAIHANNDNALENGETPLGNVIVAGGNLTLYSHDDGLHADGTLTISGGTVYVTKSYEGLEGAMVRISGGSVSVTASDDGINSTVTSGTGVEISGGSVYINCTGDGIDSNSRSSYSGIVFSGGRTVVIANSGMNSAIDTEQGYAYTGGYVVAIMPTTAMTGEATHCSNFSSKGKKSSLSLTSGYYLTVKEGSDTVVAVKMPMGLTAVVVYLGSNTAQVTSEKDTAVALDSNGVGWNR